MADENTIKIAAGEWMPYGSVVAQDDGGYTMVGPLKELLDVFTRYIPMEYELVPQLDSVWGVRLPNGSWTGMIGRVHRQEVEMALGPFTITPQRNNICDFSVPLRHENFGILTPRPDLQNDMSGILKPFTLQVWLLTLASLLGVSSTMVCVVWSEDKIFRLVTRNVVTKALTWMLLTLTQESSEWLPQRDGGRLIVTTWLLASLVFMTSYSGILTAMLTVPRVTIKVDSLADLVTQSALPWRIEAGVVMLTYLKESKDEVRQKAYREMSPTIVACLSERQAIADGKFAAICDETTMMKAMAVDFSTSGQCHLYMTREKVRSSAMMSLAFRKDSQYLARVNHLVRVLLESGLWDKWLGDQLANSSHCLRHPRLDRRDGIQPLNIEAFTGPLLVLLAGILPMTGTGNTFFSEAFSLVHRILNLHFRDGVQFKNLLQHFYISSDMFTKDDYT